MSTKNPRPDDDSQHVCHRGPNDLAISALRRRPRALWFRIGPWQYRVRVVAGPILDDQGRELLGQTSEDDRQILISSRATQRQRVDVLFHELRHAWRFHFGYPADEEAQCDYFASIMASTYQDLEAQGGREALEQLEPEAELVGLDAAFEQSFGVLGLAEIGPGPLSRWSVRVVRGRLVLNGTGRKAIIRDDLREIQVSDLLNKQLLAEVVAEAVAQVLASELREGRAA